MGTPVASAAGRFGKAVTALSQLTDGVVVLSTDNKVLLVNPAARRLLFLSHEDDYLGRSFSEAVRDPMIKTLIESARKYQVGCGDSVELASGKTVRPIRVDVNPIELVGDGELLLIIRDETETRRVDEIRREFVANVSHELKTPLAAIKGYAETVELAIQDDPESACHFMQQILSQCQRLERLVADMMQLARAQAGTHNMTLVRVELGDVIAEALHACQPIAESKQINLTCGDIHADSRVIADREATLTIANNLISNALRYTPEGGNVVISTERLNEYCALIVQDDGVGISESDQRRIFERFYRVDKTRESTGGGTGIGLSIVKNLTLAQSGQIELTSRPGKRFHVPCPAAGRHHRERSWSDDVSDDSRHGDKKTIGEPAVRDFDRREPIMISTLISIIPGFRSFRDFDHSGISIIPDHAPSKQSQAEISQNLHLAVGVHPLDMPW